MALSEILIPVSTEVAKAYSQASKAQRDLAIRVFADFLKPRSVAEADAAFDAARERISDEAKASGLTPEILEEILAADR